MQDRILLIRTGGTIDAQPYDDVNYAPDFVTTLKDGDSLVMPTIRALANHALVDEYHCGKWEEGMFVKDSDLFTPQNVLALAHIIKKDERNFFILTHGTDAMAKNAAFLQKLLDGSGKTVAFTGAMVPLSMQHQHPSDGIAGLAYTIDNIAAQPPGVYIVGRATETGELGFFNPSKVHKDWARSRETLNFTLAPGRER